MEKSGMASIAIGIAGLLVGTVGLITASGVNDRNEAYHSEQLSSDAANGAKIYATDANVSTARGDLNALQAASAVSSHRIGDLESAWVGTSVSFSCYSPWFSPEEFSVDLGWANFGKQTAHGVSFTITIHWGSGNSHVDHYFVGEVYGNTLGSHTVSSTFETGGCDGVWMEQPVIEWT